MALFSKNDLDIRHTSLVKHEIKLKDETPFKEYSKRIPLRMYEEMQAHTKEMLNIGAIRPSSSSLASLVVVVYKKYDRLQCCIDLWKLNGCTIKNAYAIPWIQDTPDVFKRAVWFTSLDLKSGYWQVEMEMSHKAPIAFTLGPLRFYKCK